jgi:AraC family transcriptional regulator of adaptative response/methylated-DNA-[protein]-cysteine methyltransferase
MTIEQDPRWAAILARDPKADALFVYGVKTTGVYCRPSSASRLPRPQNIEFFDTPAQAEAAGYRASKRAAGDRTQVAAHHAQLVANACRHIEQAESPPSLEVLAAQTSLSGSSPSKIAHTPRALCATSIAPSEHCPTANRISLLVPPAR